jgi:2'-hydroxyisoflavone reductase
MRILIIGGTRFVGRAVVEAALGRGDAVTMFNRGISAPGIFPGVATVVGDRTADLSALEGREFDAVIDVACYDPAAARLAADAFAGRTGRYVFVSTVSVYADQSTTEGQLEDAGLAQLKPGTTDFAENYGANKAVCEQIIRAAFGDRALIGRPGLITGPHDPTDRFPYWPRRIARGGRVLAPGDAGDLTQVIDVRDLAAFLLDGVHRDRGGVFNLTGAPRAFGILLDLCRTATYSDAELTWVTADALRGAGVDPEAGIPLWVGLPGYEAHYNVDSSHAVGVGLSCRPITETIRDTLAWDRGRGGPERPGLDPAEEERLLAALAPAG